jgi:hypothetical protein
VDIVIIIGVGNELSADPYSCSERGRDLRVQPDRWADSGSMARMRASRARCVPPLYVFFMTLEESLHQIKLRLQDQQEKVR